MLAARPPFFLELYCCFMWGLHFYWALWLLAVGLNFFVGLIAAFCGASILYWALWLLAAGSSFFVGPYGCLRRSLRSLWGIVTACYGALWLIAAKPPFFCRAFWLLAAGPPFFMGSYGCLLCGLVAVYCGLSFFVGPCSCLLLGLHFCGPFWLLLVGPPQQTATRPHKVQTKVCFMFYVSCCTVYCIILCLVGSSGAVNTSLGEETVYFWFVTCVLFI